MKSVFKKKDKRAIHISSLPVFPAKKQCSSGRKEYTVTLIFSHNGHHKNFLDAL